MGWLSKILGFRWSIYFIHGQEGAKYALHENSILRMIGYIMLRYKDGARPIPPWRIVCNFNRTNDNFDLRPEHFSEDCDSITERLIADIEAIDPKWKVSGAEPILVDARTKKRLPFESPRQSIEEMLNDVKTGANATRPKDIYAVLNEVFGKRR